ncbi:putative competence-damage inducible protein [Pseudodesulfovibrio hydrargyri]|uniref:Molybdopterin molybdenumtransferase n=1 Tax=Pseudodesulfovibrio hydrargyri TaxID=2125990 RepID=A0A1J5MWG4_9BACT|nr:molybdopterin-binding protein [Pseudodesulfovibrio hydrargyri]OIQ50870.1 putative competence-damage inducible protein [Pseudodesulfovibrio hydrargyri]
MKVVPVESAVGMVLCHDMTRIVPDEYKGPAFRKGHVVTEKDIPVLLRIGKEHIYVLDMPPGKIHEDEAAVRIAKAAAGPGLTLSPVSEGRVNMKADPGLLDINVEALYEINSIEEVVLSTMHTGMTFTAPRDVAGTRVVPLVVDESKIEQVEAICAANYPVIQVRPLQPMSVGIVTTGSEIFHGRIKDKFGPVLNKKFGLLGSKSMGQTFVGDEVEATRDAILQFVVDGADMVMVTGGMSVDPDDQTPAGIRATGADVVTYGSPTFPGAMFLLAYLGDVPILGLPGCVMYYRASIFDLVVPRLLAGERLNRSDIISMGHGGFCAGCDTCRYPLCSFGKHD